jgi:predicted transcriptional regulator
MSLAEQKLQLLQMVINADEETTGKLIELASQLRSRQERFTEDEILEFEKRREAYKKNPNTGVRMEESLARLRSDLKK